MTSKQKQKKGQLHTAFSKGDIEKIMKFAKNIPDYAKASIPFIMKEWLITVTWTTPLSLAIIHGNYHLCELLLEDGGDLRGKLEKLRPLSVALQSKQPDIVELLIRRGANVNLLENDGNTYPMYWAIHENNPPHILEKIISAGFPASGLVLKEERLSAVHCAVQQNNMEALEVLMKHSANLNAIDARGATALNEAIRLNSPNAVKLLVKNGAKLNNREERISPLLLAISLNNLTMVELLLDLGVSTEEGWVAAEIIRPLDFVIYSNGDLQMHLITKTVNVTTKIPLSNKKDLEMSTYKMDSISIEGTIKSVQLKIAKVLIEKGADINGKDSSGRTTLDKAVSSENLELCKLLLREGSEVTGNGKIKPKGDYINRFDYIIHVSAFKCSELVKLCLERGGDYNYRDRHGLTPYHCALANHNPSVVKVFWQFSCPYDQPENLSGKLKSVFMSLNEDNKRILKVQEEFMEGIKKNKLELVLSALVKGAEPKGCSVKIPSTLHHVAANGNYKLLRVLLENGVPVSKLNKKGQTPLYTAVQKNHIQACVVLLQFGACYNHLGSEAGSTVKNLAQGHQQIYDLFKKISNCFRLVKQGHCEVIGVLEQCIESKDIDLLLALMNCVNKKGLTLTGVALSLKHRVLARKLMKIRLEKTETAASKS